MTSVCTRANGAVQLRRHQTGKTFVTSLLFLAFICCLSISVEGLKDGLYSSDTDFVTTLDADTFEAQVINSRPSLIWIVEFYNSWCGHCIHFAPTWKKLAEDMKDWKDLVVIAAIDCSQSKNIKPCRQFDISSYPTMKMFPPSEVPGRLEKVSPIKTQSLPEIKTIILDFMTEFAPETWPKLKHLDKMQDLWHEKNVHTSQLFIIFEEEKSEVGRQVVLDLRNVTGIKVRMMLKNEVVKFGITEYPSLYRFNKDSTYSKLAVGKGSSELDRPTFVKHIIEEMKTSQADPLIVFPENKQQSVNTINKPGSALGNKSKLHPNRIQVNMQDLESALHYSLRQEIAICQTIDGERMDALKNYIDVLKKTETQYLPEVIQWASCQGSSPQYRGFPCSMWTLFHVLTVGAHTQNGGRSRSDPREVLLAIRGYMKHFFGCSQCSQHFLEMSQSVRSEVTSHTQSILWLWRRHNQVNERLRGDQSEDPKFPKLQFPPETLCAACKSAGGLEWDKGKVLEFLIGFYSQAGIFFPEDLQSFQREGDTSNIDSNKDSLGDITKGQELDWWENKQEDKDLKHVRELRLRRRNRKRALGQGSLYRAGERLSLSKDEMVRARQKVSTVRSLWGLTDIDLSMCVVFYILSTLIILLLYHHFIIRRHMNPCKAIKTKSMSL
ncbi:sulfhydryl oxidase [Elysia marginata]|uniref:Sulfhydryl oxidase n=1 Tax=Elysia marginata TaxID=1093978 RepID=A0AAV4G0L1_9GAST|nr:sulfhydryl oxidase [Elysia marginata]